MNVQSIVNEALAAAGQSGRATLDLPRVENNGTDISKLAAALNFIGANLEASVPTPEEIMAQAELTSLLGVGDDEEKVAASKKQQADRLARIRVLQAEQAARRKAARAAPAAAPSSLPQAAAPAAAPAAVPASGGAYSYSHSAPKPSGLGPVRSAPITPGSPLTSASHVSLPQSLPQATVPHSLPQATMRSGQMSLGSQPINIASASNRGRNLALGAGATLAALGTGMYLRNRAKRRQEAMGKQASVAADTALGGTTGALSTYIARRRLKREGIDPSNISYVRNTGLGAGRTVGYTLAGGELARLGSEAANALSKGRLNIDPETAARYGRILGRGGALAVTAKTPIRKANRMIALKRGQTAKTASLLVPTAIGAATGYAGGNEARRKLRNAGLEEDAISSAPINAVGGAGRALGYGLGGGFLGNLGGGLVGAAIGNPLAGSLAGGAIGAGAGLGYGVYRGYKAPIEEAERLIAERGRKKTAAMRPPTLNLSALERERQYLELGRAAEEAMRDHPGVFLSGRAALLAGLPGGALGAHKAQRMLEAEGINPDTTAGVGMGGGTVGGLGRSIGYGLGGAVLGGLTGRATSGLKGNILGSAIGGGVGGLYGAYRAYKAPIERAERVIAEKGVQKRASLLVPLVSGGLGLAGDSEARRKLRVAGVSEDDISATLNSTPLNVVRGAVLPIAHGLVGGGVGALGAGLVGAGVGGLTSGLPGMLIAGPASAAVGGALGTIGGAVNGMMRAYRDPIRQADEAVARAQAHKEIAREAVARAAAEKLSHFKLAEDAINPAQISAGPAPAFSGEIMPASSPVFGGQTDVGQLIAMKAQKVRDRINADMRAYVSETGEGYNLDGHLSIFNK